MAVCYNKLFKLMIDQKISNAELRKRAGISANIISKLKHDRYISLDSIEKICGVMGCSVDQMLEFVPEQDEVKE
ncbi:helix-turn-helix transcriptional regulator [Clostridiales Family XIII bacterium RF-744-FAT-WT-3]|uniref:Helix-turn-helix transcriptional regulator n=1 Tax=Baileyella intestinalis TaxID=2606709 RepID=A0A6A8MD14_9FIRM|nr:helix-turn-helix transcriptional regulator [Baileyella intestinalis]MST69627.1 helix-turn-helix transcriptional regulator [Baileyella intestinalis]